MISKIYDNSCLDLLFKYNDIKYNTIPEYSKICQMRESVLRFKDTLDAIKFIPGGPMYESCEFSFNKQIE